MNAPKLIAKTGCAISFIGDSGTLPTRLEIREAQPASVGIEHHHSFARDIETAVPTVANHIAPP